MRAGRTQVALRELTLSCGIFLSALRVGSRLTGSFFSQIAAPFLDWRSAVGA
jgi:hypothetical protein